MIRLQHVTKHYPNGQLALQQISFHIAPGEMVFLQGHSGAGKSTLLRLIAGLERPTHGTIWVAGQALGTLTPAQIPYYRRQLGFITQHPQLLIHRSVFENVAMPLRLAPYDRHDIAKRVRSALERVSLGHKAHALLPHLSEGEKQRVGIARAIVHRPKLVLADEPTGNLDAALSLEIVELFARFEQVGVSVLMASHDTTLINQFTHRRLTLKQGELDHAG